MRKLSKLCATAAAFAVAAGLWGVSAQPVPAADDGATRQLIEKTCSGCHEIGQVTGAHRSRDDWAVTLDKMIGFGAQISDADYEKIVAYLAAHQGPPKQ